MNLPASRLPEPNAVGEGSAPERPTRARMAVWDRTKFLLLFVLLFVFFVWGELSDNPLIDVDDALATTLEAKRWLLWLTGLELLRQAHFLLSEHNADYHHFWTEQVFARFEKRTARLNPWNRYRLARALKLVAFLAVLSVVLGAIFDVAPVTALFELPARIWDVLPFVFQLAFAAFYVVFQFAAIFWFLSRGGTDVYFPDDIKTRFSDVWGQDRVLDRVKENIVFLEQPELIEEKGGYVPSGILLWGPPGTGKTLMAEAVAGETGKPFVFVDPGAFTNMFMGVGILKVKSLFRKLRKLALRYGGVIVFFDEADSLGNRGALAGGPPGGWGGAFSPDADEHLSWASEAGRQAVLRSMMANSTPVDLPRHHREGIFMAGMGGGAGMGTLQALLTELSGLKKPRGFFNRIVRRTLGMKPKPPPKYRILVMMATNLPQALDEALLRPGRIDRMYKVGYPSKDGRKRTYEGYLAKVSHGLTDEQVEKLSVITPYATGASIKDLVNEALIIAIRDGRDTITWTDVITAKHLKTLGPGEDVEYVNRERHAIAVHEACHAIAAYRLRRHADIDIATIEKGTRYLGMVSNVRPDDQFVQWRSEYETDIKVLLASLAGERMFFGGDNSSGVHGDLESATTWATMMEGFWGMGETISSYSVAQRVIGGGGGGPRPGGDDEGAEGAVFSEALGRRIESNLRRLYEETDQLLRDNRREVLALAHALETYRTISGEDVAAVVEGTAGPLVDGQIYVTDEFLAEAERYHALAVAAHDTHSTVAEPMPDWRPPPALVALSPNGAEGDGSHGDGISGNGSEAPVPEDPFGYPSAPPVAGEGGSEDGR